MSISTTPHLQEGAARGSSARLDTHTDTTLHTNNSLNKILCPCMSLFVFLLQIGSRSSVYSPESNVRKTGSYIYEEFMPTDGTDVKVINVINLRPLQCAALS